MMKMRALMSFFPLFAAIAFMGSEPVCHAATVDELLRALSGVNRVARLQAIDGLADLGPTAKEAVGPLSELDRKSTRLNSSHRT